MLLLIKRKENYRMQQHIPPDIQIAAMASGKKEAAMMLLFTILLIAAFFISLGIGRYALSPGMIIRIIAGRLFPIDVTWSRSVETVLFRVRIPRILAGILVGGALSASGAAYQGLFRNPMVSPDILGVSSGAGFGAAIAILFSFGPIGVQGLAFAFGLTAVFMTFCIRSTICRGDSSPLVLVLTGMVVSTLCTSFTSMIKYMADTEDKLPDITYWLMGSLARSRSLHDVFLMVIPILTGGIPLFLIRWKLNIFTFGEDEAKAMGINTTKLRVLIIICATLLTAASIAASGMIGWVGLIIPHAARLLVGPNYRQLLPASFLVGSIFMVIVDTIARSAFTIEIPLGILTSVLGAPFFVYLLSRGKKAWN